MIKKSITKPLGLLFLGIFFIFSNCKKESIESDTEEVEIIQNKNELVNLKEHPEILNYISSNTTKGLEISINNTTRFNYIASRGEDDITLLSIDTSAVVQNTNENNISNYSFIAKAETNNQSEFKFTTYNYIVSQYGTSFYSFIIEKEYDINWIKDQEPGNFNHSTFTGALRVFTMQGLFVQEIVYNNGIVSESRSSDPCSGAPIDGDPGGTGGWGIVVYQCFDCLHEEHQSFHQTADCTHPICIVIANFDDSDPNGNIKDILRSSDPCSGGGGPGNGDPGDGDNTGNYPEECYLPNGDPIDCENPDIPLTSQELQDNYFSLLIILADNIPNFWVDYINEISWLGDNKEIATDMLYYLVEENYSNDSINFVVMATQALLAGVVDSFSNIVIEDSPDSPINNIAVFLECFDISSPAQLTIYVLEPNPGTGNTHDGNFVGHTFVSLSQGSNTSVFGFYPTSDWISPLNTSSTSVLGDDGSGNEPYTTSVSSQISGNQLQQIIDISINHEGTYNLNTYNCTDFAIEIGNLGGIILPESNGSWPGGSGSNPGTLGLYLIDNPSVGNVNTTSGNAPISQKGC